MARRPSLRQLLPSHARIHRIMSGEDRGPAAVALRGLTLPATLPYRAAVTGRNALYAAGILPTRDLGRPTLSVGNLTAGGTGKTPMVIALARLLQAMGHRPAVLLRGYEPKGYESKRGSDEAAELRGSLGGGVPVMPDADRLAGARRVLEQHPETSVFLLDDGFQHRRARRDLNLVLVDTLRPFGFDHLLPRGLLREPVSALRRADAVILTRTDRAEVTQREAVSATIRRLTGRSPLAESIHDWSALRLAFKPYPLERIAQQAVLGVAGIGNPQDFADRLKQVAGRCVGVLTYDDHYRYSRDELAGIFSVALERGAQAVVTTEKDYVKWRTFASGVKARLPVYRPVVALRFTRGAAELQQLLDQKFPAPPSAATPGVDKTDLKPQMDADERR